MSLVILVGAFPPPTHGAALVNEKIKFYLLQKNIEVKIINLSLNLFTNSFFAKILRIFTVILGFFEFIKTIFLYKLYLHKKITLYIGLSGSYGQIYDLIFVFFARFFKCSIFLHHHSFAYIIRKRFYVDFLAKVSGQESHHIVLCDCMEKSLKKNYPCINKFYTVSNASIIDLPNIKFYPRERLETIAFLGNISSEKGIFEFLEVVSKLSSHGVLFNAQIAGPFLDSKIESLVLQKISALENLKYVGPKYGESKTEFLSEIDVLLFPTKYVHEAEPLTILEAMCASVPVISYNRGCISNMINSQSGLVIDQEEDFVDKTVEQIRFWQQNPHVFQQFSLDSNISFSKLKSHNDIKLENLIHLMSIEY